MSAKALLSAGNDASFRMQVSRTTRKVGPGVSQRPCASLRFDECNRLGLGHRLAVVLAVRTGQCRGQLEPDTRDGSRSKAVWNSTSVTWLTELPEDDLEDTVLGRM
jgi:hypothetical protein